ncbi:uncharacterized protein LOC105749442 isoform X3 [Sarcophilus harrisii]|uniref:uncharacterized protein LOC105749442 isoform X3 n=1 Tax=Sarcophilus harrisii TaxID=9305 RepID=UPI0013020188|nr:uncharacterized protein LOC105749442 isoform X3 [Sarcophilus harrisii]
MAASSPLVSLHLLLQPRVLEQEVASPSRRACPRLARLWSGCPETRGSLGYLGHTRKQAEPARGEGAPGGWGAHSWAPSRRFLHSEAIRPSTDPGMPVFRQSCSESYKPQVRGLKDSNSTIKTGKTRLVFVCLLSSGSDGKQPLPPLGWRRPHLSPGPPRAVTKVTRPSEPFSLLAFGPGSPLLLPHCRPGLESPSYLPHPTPRPMPLNVFSWCELERGEGGLVGPPRRLRMLRGPVFCSPSSCGGRQRVTPCGPEPQPGKSRGTRPTLAPEPTVGALKLPGGLLAQRTGPPLTRLPRDGRKKSGLPALLTRERVEPPVSRPAWPEGEWATVERALILAPEELGHPSQPCCLGGSVVQWREG